MDDVDDGRQMVRDAAYLCSRKDEREQAMTERERMLAGMPYHAMDAELVAARLCEDAQSG